MVNFLITWWQRKQNNQAIEKRSSFIESCLKFCSYIYQSANYIHRISCQFYIKKAPLMVISIGSPVAGGSGKTPFTRALAAWLNDYAKVAILSRGYGSSIQVAQRVNESLNADQVGDEPWMLAGLHTGMHRQEVFVGANRFKSCVEAKKKGFEIVLLDDGMQHYKLYKDVSIAIITLSDLDQKLLPYGRLREPLSQLAYCNWICIKANPLELSESDQAKVKALNKPICFFDFESDHLYQAPEGIAFKWDHWQGSCVFAFAGIAHPQSLPNLLVKKGLRVCFFEALADHQPITKAMLDAWMAQAISLGAKAIVCTEKDWARISHWAGHQSYPLPILWPHLQMQWMEGSLVFFDFLKQRFLPGKVNAG